MTLIHHEWSRDPQNYREDLVSVGYWTLTRFSLTGVTYVAHSCEKQDLSYLVSYKHHCELCKESVPDEIQALWLLIGGNDDFVTTT